MTGDSPLLYLDAFSGLGGDMLCAALLDLAPEAQPALEAAIEALPFAVEIRHERAERHGIDARRFVVEPERAPSHRSHADVDSMLADASLEPRVAQTARATFAALAEAEGRVHGRPASEVTFHEVGALDSIVDVLGACALLTELRATVVCSPLPLGRGFVRAAHGRLPLPAPATLALLCGAPTYDGGVEAELVTPTAAALLRTWVSRFGRWPAMSPRAVGLGAGSRTLEDRPNVLRAVLGEAARERAPRERALHEVSANVDDATPEELAFALEAAFEAGARDAWASPIVMKKGRAATMLCALCEPASLEAVERALLTHSPTLGVRTREVRRVERARRVIEVQTRFGPVPVKIADDEGLPLRRKPEHDACAALARTHGVPLRAVVEAALAAADEL